MANIYVGNLAFEVTEADLMQAFQAFGQVSKVSIVMDRMTGRSRGFGFVEMPDKAQAEAAMSGLNLKEIKGRAVTVNEARPKGQGGRSGGRG